MSRLRFDLPKEEISGFCRRWKIIEFAVFGSALREDFGPHSDVDVLVTFGPDAKWTLFDHVRMKMELESLFGREVDVISRRALERSRNRIRRQSILDTAVVIHAA